jgi:hypothetical protein
MRWLLPVAALLAVACGAVPTHAQTVALAFHKGDVYKYTFHSLSTEDISTGAAAVPLNVDVSAKETVTVQSVDSGGVANLSITLSNLAITSKANGVTNTTSGLAQYSLAIRMAADGRILNVNGFSISGGSGFGMGQLGSGATLVSAVLPDTAVKPGDTWVKDYDQANPLGTGTIHITTRSKYLRDQSFQGSTAAVVETASAASIDVTVDPSKFLPPSPTPGTTITPSGFLQVISIKGTTSSDITSWINPNGHSILKSHMTATTNDTVTIPSAAGSALPGVTGPMTVKISDTTDLLPA